MKRCFVFIICGILCLLLIIYVVVPIIRLMLFSHASQTKYYAEFQSYKDNFVLIKDFIMEKYPDSWNTCLCVDIMEDGSRTLYDPHIEEYLELPKQVSSALKTIDEHAFPNKDSDFDLIRIYGSRISFSIVNGQYSLVYSSEGKPTFVNGPNEGCELFVKNLGDGWYHVVKRPS